MKKKLIKLSDNHYIVVDDSEIKENDWCYNKVFNSILRVIEKLDNYTYLSGDKKAWFKITHSTKPLINHPKNQSYDTLILSEVEEVINGYSVEKIIIQHGLGLQDDRNKLLFRKGFKAHQELTKDKLFTLDDMENAYNSGKGYGPPEIIKDCGSFIKSLLQPKEWNVEFVDGKLKLI